MKHCRLLKHIALGGLLAWLAAPVPANAYDNDEALERYGQLCTRQIAHEERRNGIPQRLLGAVAATETGRRHKGLGILVPWPWSINVEGAPYVFRSKEEAVAAVQKFQAQGKRSIDVGCMQVNLLHHPKAFATVAQAFEPRYNVAYAAKFLRNNYEETRSWKTAVGYYHSRTPAHANPYAAKVYSRWYGLATGQKEAKAQRPRKQYNTFVRVENSGNQVNFSGNDRAKLAKAPEKKKLVMAAQDVSADRRVLKMASPTAAKQRSDLTIIRPTEAAGKVAQPSTVDKGTTVGPLVMNNQAGGEKLTAPAAPKVIHVNLGETGVSDDRRFIQFSN